MTRDVGRPDAAARWRLFVALPVPEDAASSVADSLAGYRTAFPDARWLRPDLLHVTVRFLGGVRPDAVPDLVQAVTSVATSAGPTRARDGPGHRVTHGVAAARWVSRGCPSPTGTKAVRDLCSGLDPLLPVDALASPDLRPPPDAHVTVARHASVELIGALREQRLGPTRVTWTADRMVLYRSHTGTPAGSRYEPLAEARLGARAAA